MQYSNSGSLNGKNIGSQPRMCVQIAPRVLLFAFKIFKSFMHPCLRGQTFYIIYFSLSSLQPLMSSLVVFVSFEAG